MLAYKASVLQILEEKQKKFRPKKNKICLHSDQRNCSTLFKLSFVCSMIYFSWFKPLETV